MIHFSNFTIFALIQKQSYKKISIANIVMTNSYFMLITTIRKK